MLPTVAIVLVALMKITNENGATKNYWIQSLATNTNESFATVSTMLARNMPALLVKDLVSSVKGLYVPAVEAQKYIDDHQVKPLPKKQTLIVLTASTTVSI